MSFCCVTNHPKSWQLRTANDCYFSQCYSTTLRAGLHLAVLLPVLARLTHEAAVRTAGPFSTWPPILQELAQAGSHGSQAGRWPERDPAQIQGKEKQIPPRDQKSVTCEVAMQRGVHTGKDRKGGQLRHQPHCLPYVLFHSFIHLFIHCSYQTQRHGGDLVLMGPPAS